MELSSFIGKACLRGSYDDHKRSVTGDTKGSAKLNGCHSGKVIIGGRR